MGIYTESLASIGDTVWYDDNRDGIQGAEEKGVNGVKVTLLKDCTTEIATTLTDAKGTYIFRDLASGSYCVKFSELPSAYKISPKDEGGNDTLDSDVDPSTFKTEKTTLNEGENDLSWDMGIYTESLASIGDTVWYDDNRDGIQGSEEKGVNGVKVTLLKDCTTEIATTLTDAKGTYIFRDLASGSYCVEFSELPSAYKISPKDEGRNDTLDSDVDPITFKTEKTILDEGENDLSWDMGIYTESLASIGDTVWYDDNRDGLQSENEKGVEAVKVTLYNDVNVAIGVTTTDRKGVYQFRGLVPGIYSLGFSDLPVDYIITKQVDSPTKGSDANPTTGRTVTTELLEGEVDLSWDMGIYTNSLATIGDAVWYDDNKDGLQSENEKGVEAVKVTLYNDANVAIKVTTTDRKGVYQFRGLVPGIYSLGFSDLPVDYILPSN
jgi:protocatechuate 3,4-dioxygenase beta subunit